MTFSRINTIGLAKDNESPENPQGLDKRVALIPSDIGRLAKSGCAVFFESGAGERIGFSDSEYEQEGAQPQNAEEIYQGKDMVIKIKGPSLKDVRRMSPHSILFCMAHFRSFPERARLLKQQQINVIAMEEILESPKTFSDEIILSKSFVQEMLASQNHAFNQLNVGFIGFHESLIGGIRRAGNRNTKTLNIYQEDIRSDELKWFGNNSIYFYDSHFLNNQSILSFLKQRSSELLDLREFEQKSGLKAVQEYRDTHPPFELGGRKIQCLRETGVAGAKYGFHILKTISPKQIMANETNAVVLGYGNVGMGAIEECYNQGVRAIHVLNRRNTASEQMESYLARADLMINGAEQAPEVRGKNYLIRSEHVNNAISKGSVIIDLIGGSPSNRSPVEDVVECTFLTEPYFTKNEIFISALWGWPMMGLMRESACRYSGQIVDVLTGQDNLLNGLQKLSKGVEHALVCGPFS